MVSSVILVVSEDKRSRETLRAILFPDGFQIIEAYDYSSTITTLNQTIPDLVIINHSLDGNSGLELAKDVKSRLPYIPLIMIADTHEDYTAVQSSNIDIFTSIRTPFNANDLRLSIGRALEEKRLKDEIKSLKGQLEKRSNLLTSMGNSEPVQRLVKLLEKTASMEFTVLIEGESGSGKELISRTIHEMSPFSDGPFIAVDCGAIPESLFESELFGHEKGAFTGATSSKIGFFEAAHNGTLFLDEICNMPYSSQGKLLRTIEERRVQRLGSTKTKAVKVRIVAATNRPLEQEVEKDLFRVDLLYRLKEVSIQVPPLRERKEDIFYLAQRFLNELQDQLPINCLGFSREAIASMLQYAWPGNVRELRNCVRQAALSCENNQYIQPPDLSFNRTQSAAVQPRRFDHAPPGNQQVQTPAAIGQSGPAPQPLTGLPPAPGALELAAGQSLTSLVRDYTQAVEIQLIKQALETTGGNKMKASKLLKIDYKTLYRKLKQYDIQ